MMKMPAFRPVRRLVPAATALAVASLVLAGCQGGSDPSSAASASASAGPDVQPSADATGSGNGAVVSNLDFGALTDRQQPERLLQFYTSAIRSQNWAAAAKAWSLDAQMTPDKLKAEFAGAGARLTLGKGDVEGAAGSLYYEAPLVVDFSDGRPSQRGTIVVRRVNDVPGASEEQLNWRIERTSTFSS
ncbi:hypothetical protein [Novosphingobium sp. 9]|uniref:hypothetical protein n=1 Tax=Novosphingobium sp. 9 TaxID=2025349 RepID=UPI0021B517BA|nr:hypothetical protein [Novosphingobium sp. 9]